METEADVARTYMDSTHRDARDVRRASGETDVVFVGTKSLVPLDTELDDERPVPHGTVSVRLLRRDTGVPIGQFAASEDTVQQLRGLLLEPRQLGLSCAEEYPGVVGQLLVLLPPSDLEGLMQAPEDRSSDEDWRRSLDEVPDLSGEAAASPPAGAAAPPPASPKGAGPGEGRSDDRLAALHAGNVVRFEADRRHPASLAREAADLLREALEGPLPPLSDRLIEELAHGASADD